MNAQPLMERPKTKLREELDTLAEASEGYLSPRSVVKWAEQHPDSALHAKFEWDDSKAAQKYRLSQARQIIRVHVETVVENGQNTRAFVSLQKDRVPERGYKALRDVLDDPVERRILVAQARRELARLRQKYAILEELGGVWDAIDAADSAAEMKEAG